MSLGANKDVTITHDADDGIELKSAATTDDNPVLLTLQSGEADIAADDVIGTLNFQAPDEGEGTDAILVAAGIEAVSEGDFSATSNATKLSFKTGSSEAATEKMSLSSDGVLTARYGATVSSAISSDRELTTSDNGKVLICDAAVELTVPQNLPVGFNCLIVQYSTTDSHYVTITPASGVTVGNNNNHTRTYGRYAVMSLVSVASNIFISSGDGQAAAS